MNEKRISKLITELKEGNTECLREIFEKHGDYCVQNLIKKKGCPPEQAEDIFLDAILNFRDKILAGKVKFLTSMRSYIYATCVNMYLADRYQQGRFERKTTDIRSALYNHDDTDYLTTTIAHEHHSELMRISTVSFDALDEKCKTVLRLFYVYEFSMAEIAEKMQMASKDVAKTTKSRCFKKWSKLVEAHQKNRK